MSEYEKKVKKAIQGDRSALQHLIKTEKDKLYRVAFSYVRNEEDAVDVFQQTTLFAIESIHQLKEPKYFSTWLTRICINLSIKVLRDKQKVISIENINAENASGRNVSLEEKIDLLDAICKLDEKYKTVLILKYYNDLTMEQIAENINMPLGTVKTNIRRGLEQLRPFLKGVYVDERTRESN
ncbi:sigma-70 family RNA polymerase sigma factor (plasmid) [Cytobacillus solani]|uniref:sigma-70 family RNA polymerase sigma factor n=1 Tax=Cytobacillus solani TaxID=1637975 RepID=UPI002079C035|nr:sigma-70 family RNA polymerase sigma factor [Cytobacillus solani]USK57732.1 sigma-70 family RNA polymerase sigma factor [Cytobacillus solani]